MPPRSQRSLRGRRCPSRSGSREGEQCRVQARQRKPAMPTRSLLLLGDSSVTTTSRDEDLRLTAKRADGIISHMCRRSLLVLASFFPCVNSSSGFSACASDSDLMLDTVGFSPLSARGWWVFKHPRRDVSEHGWPSSASRPGSIPAGKPPWMLENPAARRKKAFAASLPSPTRVYADPDAAHHHLHD